MDMFRSIVAAAEQIAQMPSVRSVILRGNGKVFCAGLDVKSVAQNPMNMSALLERPEGKLANLAQNVAMAWRDLPVPVLAVTHGVCFGGGMQIALGADIRFSTPDCDMSIMEAKWGLVPDMSASVTLRELIPIDLAKELTMTAKVFKGTEAKAYGLVSHVSNTPFEDARGLAREIAAKSPDATAASKRLYNSTWLETPARALEIETELQRKLLADPLPLRNTLAAASKGLKLPVQMDYKDRQDHWTDAK